MVSFQPALLVCVLALTAFSLTQGQGYRPAPERQRRPAANPRPSLTSRFRQRFGLQARSQGSSSQGNNQASSSNNNYYNAPAAAPSSSASGVSDRDSYAGGNSGSYSGGSSGGSYGGSSSSYGGSSAGSYGGGYDEYGGELKPLAALVAPLAALALLGAAAAVATSPVLLTLAVLSSGRKRRDIESINGLELTPEMNKKLHEMEVLEKYIAKIPQEQQQQEKLMSTYLSCSGYTESDNQCMDRLVCEYSVLPSKMQPLEKDVISIVLYNIMANKYVSKDFKERLRAAAQTGRNGGSCQAYKCDQLSN